MQKLIIDTTLLESMLFIWASLADREKIVDSFLIDLANQPNMKAQYDADFNAESVRKVLSAISNREKMNDPTKKESRFWNNCMWMMEDPLIPESMLGPVKRLSAEQLREEAKDAPVEDAELIFYPGTTEISFKEGNKFYVNFFSIMADMFDETKEVTIDKIPLTEYLVKELKTLGA